MALLTIVIPSVYYLPVARPKPGLDGGEIQYDVTQGSQPGEPVTIEFGFRAATYVSDIVLRLGIANGVTAKDPTLDVDDPDAGTPPGSSASLDGKEAVYEVASLGPKGVLIATFTCIVEQAGWSTSHFEFDAAELDRTIRGKVPFLVEEMTESKGAFTGELKAS